MGNGALETASIPLEGPRSLKIPTNIRYQWLSRRSRGFPTVYSLAYSETKPYIAAFNGYGVWLLFCIDNRHAKIPIDPTNHFTSVITTCRSIGCYRQPITDAIRVGHTGLPAGDVIISMIDLNGSTDPLWLLGWVISLYWSCNRLCILTVSYPRDSDEVSEGRKEP